MTINVYIPRDTSALAMGADDVVKALKFQIKLFHLPENKELNIIRNGSRGLFYLEPLIEVETEQGRIAYGPVTVEDVSGLLEQGMLHGNTSHPLCLGLTENIPYLAKQQRLTFARAGIIDPLNIEDYVKYDGFTGLNKALALSPQQLVDEVKNSGLRGRGGAAFPTGIKWQTVLKFLGFHL